MVVLFQSLVSGWKALKRADGSPDQRKESPYMSLQNYTQKVEMLKARALAAGMTEEQFETVAKQAALSPDMVIEELTKIVETYEETGGAPNLLDGG